MAKSTPMWKPMAIAIIFGLLFATVLTLGVVPVLYSFFSGSALEISNSIYKRINRGWFWIPNSYVREE